MALHIKSTRQWSNSTLCDGVDALLAAAQEVEQEEEEVLRMIEDPWGNMFIYVGWFVSIKVALNKVSELNILWAPVQEMEAKQDDAVPHLKIYIYMDNLTV